jgi:hypothetical protein
MKSIEEVEKAATVACRFAIVDWTKPQLTQEDVLNLVLTKSESDAYRILSNQETGPFANVWKEEEGEREGQSVPKYQWDGIQEAHKFWIDNEGTFEDWQQKSFR